MTTDTSNRIREFREMRKGGITQPGPAYTEVEVGERTHTDILVRKGAFSGSQHPAPRVKH